jgi:DNA-binding HxlR family transcriptional regulator
MMTEDNPHECLEHMLAIRDTLDVISGKWKILIIVALLTGNKRFKEIETMVPKITPKVLAKELKELERHHLIKRTIFDDYPVRIEYSATPYARTLKQIVQGMYEWGKNHRQKIWE